MINVQGLFNNLSGQMLRNKADQERAVTQQVLRDCFEYDQCRFNAVLKILEQNEKLLTHA